MKELLLKGAEQMGVAMSAEQAQAFCEYHRMLVSANKTMNLTRISDDPAEAVDRNYLDSIAPLKYPLPEGTKTLVDVGSGAGFPGIPLSILLPQVQVTLIDSLEKRVKFLESVIRELGLNARAMHLRAEIAGKEIALREEQLQKTLGDGGIFVPADWIFREENSIRGGERACRQLLNRLWAQEVRPDSLYCCSDAMAYGALQVLHRQGIRVPQDMAVLAVGNGDPDYRDACLVPLTAVQVPIEEMARQCLLLVEKLLRREEAGDVRVPAPVEERQSL